MDTDRKTHLKYRGIKNQDLRRKILDSMVWNPESETYRMKLEENAVCPMLEEDCLCMIQKNFGEDFLSDICSEFPRRVFVLGDYTSRTLSLTCPVAAKLALLNPEPMKFRSTLLRTKRSGAFFYKSISEVRGREFLKPLQMLGVEILQNKVFTLNERLAVLGFTLSMTDYKLDDPQYKNFYALAAEIRTPEFLARMKNNFTMLEFNKEYYLTLMFRLTENLFTKATFYFSEEQRNFAQYVPQAFGLTEETSKSFDELFRLYDENLAALNEFVKKPYSQLVENYMVHTFFAGLYPCRIPGNLLVNFFLYATLYKFFEFVLMCMAGVLREKLTVDDIIEWIGRFSHRTDHGSLFQEVTLEFLEPFLPYPLGLFMSLTDFKN